MPESSVTLILPSAAYDALQQRAHLHHRRVDEEAAMTLLAAIGTDDVLPPDMAAALDLLTHLDTQTLQRVSHTQPTVEDGVLLDALVDKRRRQVLEAEEERLVVELLDRHDRVMALRAEAVALLAQRGVDVQERVAQA